jgi:hypothetical protein
LPTGGPRFLELDDLQDAMMQIMRNWQALYQKAYGANLRTSESGIVT